MTEPHLQPRERLVRSTGPIVSKSPGTTAVMSEVKGAWFVSARRYTLEQHGRDALAEVLGEMPAEHRSALSEPLASQWYPEAAMQEALGACFRVIARGDRQRMISVIEGCAVVGVNTFFRIALRITTTTFALRMLPTTWGLLRRGAGKMDVDIEERHAVIRYSAFPYFDDPNYRALVSGTLRPLLRMSTGREPDVEITDWTADTLRAVVRFR